MLDFEIIRIFVLISQSLDYTLQSKENQRDHFCMISCITLVTLLAAAVRICHRRRFFSSRLIVAAFFISQTQVLLLLFVLSLINPSWGFFLYGSNDDCASWQNPHKIWSWY